MRSNPFEHISGRGEALFASDIHIIDMIMQQKCRNSCELRQIWHPWRDSNALHPA